MNTSNIKSAEWWGHGHGNVLRINRTVGDAVSIPVRPYGMGTRLRDAINRAIEAGPYQAGDYEITRDLSHIIEAPTGWQMTLGWAMQPDSAALVSIDITDDEGERQDVPNWPWFHAAVQDRFADEAHAEWLDGGTIAPRGRAEAPEEILDRVADDIAALFPISRQAAE